MLNEANSKEVFLVDFEFGEYGSKSYLIPCLEARKTVIDRNNNITAFTFPLDNITQEEKETEGDLCNGLTFVITGDVYEYKNRNELKAYIESQGGKVTGSVSKSTNYLINNDLQSTSSKNQKANQLGIQIISEKDFIDRFK